jgi:Holliday junction DNA helicase RuvA
VIYSLHGTVQELLPNGSIIDVNGVGYGLEMPLSAICNLPARGQQVRVWVHTHVREDSIRLFGFLSQAEKDAFEILISLTGIGPKLGLAILSTLNLSTIEDAVRFERIEVFESVPGVGKRLAEKLLVELKAKLKKLEAVLEPGRSVGLSTSTPTLVSGARTSKNRTLDEQFLLHLHDVHSALENLGFKDRSITETLAALRTEKPGTDFQSLMKIALQRITGVTPASDIKSSSKVTSTETELF